MDRILELEIIKSNQYSCGACYPWPIFDNSPPVFSERDLNRLPGSMCQGSRPSTTERKFYADKWLYRRNFPNYYNCTIFFFFWSIFFSDDPKYLKRINFFFFFNSSRKLVKFMILQELSISSEYTRESITVSLKILPKTVIEENRWFPVILASVLVKPGR